MPESKIAVVAVTFTSPFANTLLSFMRGRLDSTRTLVTSTATFELTTQTRRLRSILSTQPSALISLGLEPQAEVVDEYRKAGAPVILIDGERPGASTITTDGFLGGRLAADHLVKRGCRKLAIVSGQLGANSNFNVKPRLDGFTRALAAHELTLVSEGMIQVRDYSHQDGMTSMQKLFEGPVTPDGIFCAAGDDCAAGMLKVIRDRGLRVPEDIAIVGYDDVEVARLSAISLTTIRQPLEEMAKAALDMAINEHRGVLAKPRKVYFRPELIVRKTA